MINPDPDLVSKGLQAAGALAIRVDLTSSLIISSGNLRVLGEDVTSPDNLDTLKSSAAPMDQAIFDRLQSGETLDVRIRLFSADHTIRHVRLIGQSDNGIWEGLILPAGPVHSGQRDRQSQEYALKAGLERGEIMAFYQPIVALDDNHLAGFEALARWDRTGVGIVEPDQFLALSRELNLESQIGEAILTRVMEDVAFWEEGDLLNRDHYVAINVTPGELNDDQWSEQVIQRLKTSGLSRGRLRIEINESDVMQDGPELLARLDTIRQAGIALMMDDFGTGYSSLARLDKLPFSFLKIDQYFIRSMQSDDASRSIVKSVCGLARHYGMSVVAEGIESAALAEAALQAGCQYGQGFWYSSALSPDDTNDLLRGNGPERIKIG